MRDHGDDAAADAALGGQAHVEGEIARRVNLKFAPELRFRVDDRFEEAKRIDKLLASPAVRRDLGGTDE